MKEPIFGCKSVDERRKCSFEDEGKEANMKAAYFRAAFMFDDDRIVQRKGAGN